MHNEQRSYQRPCAAHVGPMGLKLIMDSRKGARRSHEAHSLMRSRAWPCGAGNSLTGDMKWKRSTKIQILVQATGSIGYEKEGILSVRDMNQEPVRPIHTNEACAEPHSS